MLVYLREGGGCDCGNGGGGDGGGEDCGGGGGGEDCGGRDENGRGGGGGGGGGDGGDGGDGCEDGGGGGRGIVVTVPLFCFFITPSLSPQLAEKCLSGTTGVG